MIREKGYNIFVCERQNGQILQGNLQYMEAWSSSQYYLFSGWCPLYMGFIHYMHSSALFVQRAVNRMVFDRSHVGRVHCVDILDYSIRNSVLHQHVTIQQI